MRWSAKGEQHFGQQKLDLLHFFSILQLSFINYCRDQSPLPSAFLITFVLDENSLASVNGPDKAMRLSHCHFYIKQLKKQAIDLIATFLLELGTPRQRNLIQRNSGCVFVKLRRLFTETGTYLMNLAFILLKNYLRIALILKYMNYLYCYKNVMCIYFSMRVVLNYSIQLHP